MKRKDYCKWVDFDGDWSGNFETECGSTFTLITGDPIDNHIVFCPYCGGEVIYERTAIDSASSDFAEWTCASVKHLDMVTGNTGSTCRVCGQPHYALNREAK